ncbi:MAG: hypothetical protein ABI425_00995 [Patescibacteria group bacterium]
MRIPFQFSKKAGLILVILMVSLVLRIYKLNVTPPSLYWEEAALGYDAYSVLKTGMDHHGHWFPVVAFESFGDYKPALYFYSIIPFLFVFGLSVWSVRIPSVIAGVLIVYFSGKIAGLLFQSEELHNSSEMGWGRTLIQPEILTMIITCFSPWAIQFSRGGWEVNLATALLSIGVYFGLRAGSIVQSQPNQKKAMLSFYTLTVLLFVLSAYTYHATRVIAPLLGIVLAYPLIVRYKTNWKQICMLAVLAFGLMLPILLFIRDPSVGHRLQETSTFSTGKEVLESNFYMQQFGSNVVTKLLFHRYWFYLRTIMINAATHLRLDFLFLSGDQNFRHSIQYFGLFFPTDFVLLILSLFTLIKKWQGKYHFLWLWWVIGLIPASLALPVPHALRTLPILPVYMSVLGLGLFALIQYIRKMPFSKILLSGVAVLFCIELIMYLNFYFLAYPKLYASEWQYGYQQMVESIQNNSQSGEKVYITREYGRPAMYYWFFSKTNPSDVQSENAAAPKDQGEFLNFKNVTFSDSLTGNEKGLIASTYKQRQFFSDVTEIETIMDLKGQPVWLVYRAN